MAENWRAKYCIKRKGARKFIIICLFQLSWETSAKESRSKIEAQFTKQSTLSKTLNICGKICTTSLSSAKSACNNAVRTLHLPISRASSLASGKELKQWIMTFQPSLANPRAISLPIRFAAPVIRTVFRSDAAKGVGRICDAKGAVGSVVAGVSLLLGSAGAVSSAVFAGDFSSFVFSE